MHHVRPWGTKTRGRISGFQKEERVSKRTKIIIAVGVLLAVAGVAAFFLLRPSSRRTSA